MKFSILFLVFIVGLSACSQAQIIRCDNSECKRDEINDVEIILDRIVDDKIKDATRDTLYSDKQTGKWLESISDVGSWSDIDYNSQEPAVWEPRFHLDRTIILAVNYLNKSSAYYKSEDVKEVIPIALKYWLDIDAKSINWWWSVIGEPQRDGLLLLLLKESGIELDYSLRKGLLKRFSDRDPFSYTGANRSDVGIALLYKELFEENDDGVNKALDAIFSSVEYGEDTSFQRDGCYFESGPQLYIGGYSEVLLNNILRFAEYVDETKFRINHDKVNIISNFVRGIYSHTIRGHIMAFNCHGRSLSRQGALDKMWTAKWISRLKVIDIDNTGEYDDILNRLTGVSKASYGVVDHSQHYYIGDFTVHSKSEYNITVRALSTRTRRDEFDNGENSKGYFVDDGSTCIMCSGGEYFDIMPLWNWSYIPGTTAPEISDIPKPFYPQMGLSEFCGGVSNSGCSVVALDYFDSYKGINTGGRKGYFLFRDMMVCLGTKLYSDKPFHTTINQCWAATDNNTIMSKKGEPVIESFIPEIDKVYSGALKWLIYDNIGYWIPGEQAVRLKIDSREGCWYDINQGTGTSDIVKGKVFQLSVEHSEDDTNGAYQYVVYPYATVSDMENLVNMKTVVILSNTNNVQAVYDKKGSVLGIIFYEPDEINIGEAIISVTHPCVMLVEMGGDNYKFSIADPSQKLSDMKFCLLTQGQRKEELIHFPDDLRGGAVEVCVTPPTAVLSSDIANNDNEVIHKYDLSGKKLQGRPKSHAPFIEVMKKGFARTVVKM